jgi:hypothetical protein
MNQTVKKPTNSSKKNYNLVSVRLPLHLFNKIEKVAYQNNSSTSTALRKLIESN